jgi:hypothetical protein
VRRLEIHGRGDAASQCFLITRRAKTPFIARLETGKTPIGTRRHEIVSLKDRVIEKFTRYLHADRVQTRVLWSGATISVPIKPGYRVATTAAESGPQNVSHHGDMIAHNKRAVELLVSLPDSVKYQRVNRKESWPTGSAQRNLDHPSAHESLQGVEARRVAAAQKLTE